MVVISGAIQTNIMINGSVPIEKKYFCSTPNENEHSGAGTSAGMSKVKMEARNFIQNLLADPQLYWNGHRLQCRTVAPTWMQPFLQAGGKMLGVLERVGGIQKEHMKPNWSPLEIFDVRGRRPILLMSYDKRENDWNVQAANLANITQKTPAEILAAWRQ